MESTIITKADISDLYDIGANLNDNRINPHILRAQQNDLAPILGEALYYLFVEDYDGSAFTTAKYINLFNGTNYTLNGKDIYFRGVKPMLVSFAYARLIANNQTFITRGGVVSKDVEASQKLEERIILQKARNAKSDALALQAGLEEYLNNNLSTYPEYDKTARPKTAFNMTRVPGISSMKSY